MGYEEIEAEVERRLAERLAVARLGISDLERRLGVTRRTIWRAIRSGTFPQGEILFGQVRCWRLDEIERWEASRPPRRGCLNLGAAAEGVL